MFDVLAQSSSIDEDVKTLFDAICRFATSEALDDDTTIASMQWA